MNDGAKIINASWGFYGEGTEILRNAIDTAGVYGALVVAAAGNDTLNLIADSQYPATYELTNVISVGAFAQEDDITFTRAPFTNYGPEFVNIFAAGVDVNSSVPDDAFAQKSGTSMAAPVISAAAALYRCLHEQPAAIAGQTVLDAATLYPDQLDRFVEEGRVANLEPFCPQNVSATTFDLGQLALSVSDPDDPSSVVLSTTIPGLVAALTVMDPGGTALINEPEATFSEEGLYTVMLESIEPGEYTFIVSAFGVTRELILSL